MNYQNIGIMVWSLNAGGAERAAANLSKDLCDTYNVYLFVFDSNNITYPYGGTIVDIGAEVRNGILGKGIELIKRCNIIRKYKKKYNIDVMISYMPNSNFYNVITAGSSKTIISIRNHMSKKLKTKFEKLMITWCGKRADLTVSLSEGVRQDLIEYFHYDSKRVVTIYNSCSISWLMNQDTSSLRSEENKEKNESRSISTVGRLTYQKGQWHLLRAMKIVCQKYPNTKLLIFGEGDLQQDLMSLAKELGIEEHVSFEGFVKNHHAIMRESDLFVFPSLFEGLGNVLLEALACEMPVISTDCESGPREILDGRVCSNIIDKIEYCKYGILIPPFSMKELDLEDMKYEDSDYLLADAIISLFDDDKLREHYRKQALLRSEFFLPERIKGQWIDTIEAL